MTESKAKELMLIEKECINGVCDRDCTNCDFVQEVGYLNNAYDLAIKALEKQEKIKEIIANANQWSKEDVVVKAQAFCDIKKIVEGRA